MKVDPKAPLRDPSRYTVVGKPLPRPDVPDKCTGRHVYVHDFTLPGMLHARVIRPPAIGATLVSVDESSIRGIPDVRVVRVESFLAVVAKDEWAAVKAAGALKATWTEAGKGCRAATASIAGRVRRRSIAIRRSSIAATRRRHRRRREDAVGDLLLAVPEPRVARAVLRRRRRAAPTAPRSGPRRRARTACARTWSKVFGLSPDKVRVVFLDGSGSYGTNGGDHVAADAVLLSKTVGQPVRVQWTRQDETGWDPKGPQQLLDVQAGLDASGRIVGWDTQMWLPNQAPGARALLAADAAGLPQEHGPGAGAITQNGDPPYDRPTTSASSCTG